MIAAERKKNEKNKMIAGNDRPPKWSRILFSRLGWPKTVIMIDHFSGDRLYIKSATLTNVMLNNDYRAYRVTNPP